MTGVMHTATGHGVAYDLLMLSIGLASALVTHYLIEWWMRR